MKNLNSNYVVVFHHQYFSEHDNGCRVYRSYDQYLSDYTSMYTWLSEFASESEAAQNCAAQPVEVVESTTCIHCLENEIDEELSNELCTDCFYEYEKQQERNFINDQFNF